MTALAFAAKHTPKTLRSPQKRARPSEGSVAFPKGGDIPVESLEFTHFLTVKVHLTPVNKV
jgi:hypothetical protein